MADSQSIVVLVTGQFESPLEPEELAKRFRGGSPTGFIEIEDVKGVTHWVTTGQVVEIREVGDRSAYLG